MEQLLGFFKKILKRYPYNRILNPNKILYKLLNIVRPCLSNSCGPCHFSNELYANGG